MGNVADESVQCGLLSPALYQCLQNGAVSVGIFKKPAEAAPFYVTGVQDIHKTAKNVEILRSHDTANREATISSPLKNEIFLYSFWVMQEVSTAPALDFIMELLNIISKAQ